MFFYRPCSPLLRPVPTSALPLLVLPLMPLPPLQLAPMFQFPTLSQVDLRGPNNDKPVDEAEVASVWARLSLRDPRNLTRGSPCVFGFGQGEIVPTQLACKGHISWDWKDVRDKTFADAALHAPARADSRSIRHSGVASAARRRRRSLDQLYHLQRGQRGKLPGAQGW